PAMTLSAKAEATARRYVGARAREYDMRRSTQPKWHGEDRAVRAALAELPEAARILDVPCGTGRFFSYYLERRFDVTAIDVSEDMLEFARERAAGDIRVAKGSIFALDLPDRSVDVGVSIRFMNLIEGE